MVIDEDQQAAARQGRAARSGCSRQKSMLETSTPRAQVAETPGFGRGSAGCEVQRSEGGPYVDAVVDDECGAVGGEAQGRGEEEYVVGDVSGGQHRYARRREPVGVTQVGTRHRGVHDPWAQCVDPYWWMVDGQRLGQHDQGSLRRAVGSHAVEGDHGGVGRKEHQGADVAARQMSDGVFGEEEVAPEPSPLTVASGKKRAVLARHVRNRRLYDAIDHWALCTLQTSPGARALYDQHRAAGDLHHQALRALGNRLVGILHGCLRHHTAHSEHTAWAHRQITQAA
jgi:hypothetical protein